MNHQKIKGICRIIENTIKEKHIGKLNGADKDIFLIGEAYPGVWLEHVYDSVMYAKLFSARKQARFCGTNSTAQRRCDRQQFTRTNNTKVLWGSAPSPAHFAAKRRSDFREQARENNKFYLPRKQARFRAINASTKTQMAIQKPHHNKKQKI